MDYQIAIPSYKRAEKCVAQTLATIKRHKKDYKKNTTVFVANDDEKKIYEKLIKDVPIVVTAEKKINSTRFYSSKYYDKNTKLLNMDDDVAGLFKKNGNKIVPLDVDLDTIVEKGFSICDKINAKCWGINPTGNGMFMDDTITIGLRYICGIFYGSYAGCESLCGADRVLQSSGDDFETSIRAYKKFKNVVRIDSLTVKTKYFAEGGIVAEIGDAKKREKDHYEQLQNIAKRHPDVATLYFKSKGVPNIRLKRVTNKKIKFKF